MKNRKRFSAILLAIIGLTGLTLGVLSLLGVWTKGVLLMIPLGVIQVVHSLALMIDEKKHGRLLNWIAVLGVLFASVSVGVVINHL